MIANVLFFSILTNKTLTICQLKKKSLMDWLKSGKN